MKQTWIFTTLLVMCSGPVSAALGDGEGEAVVRMAGEEIVVSGECSDWAFRTGMGLPNLRVEVSEGMNPDELEFQNQASFMSGADAWFAKELVDLEKTETGYIFTAVFTNIQSEDSPTETIEIEVSCS